MTPAERVVTLREDLRTAAVRFCAACVDLEPLAAELADLEGQLCAAEAQAGIFDHRPGARELAAAVLLSHVGALRPSVPFVGSESAALAEAQLRKSPAPTTSTTVM
jgi:hypothetical protein